MHPRTLPTALRRLATAATTLCALLSGSAVQAGPVGDLRPHTGDDPLTIVGGERNAGDPSVPLLVVYGELGEESICTGSLVGAQWILTAAHCVDPASLGFVPAEIMVYFGTELSQTDPGYVGHTWADAYRYHELWNTQQLEAGYDIGVIHLMRPVDLPLVPLLSRPIEQADRGAAVRLVGWGLTRGDHQDSGIKRHAMSSLFDFDDLLVLIGDSKANVCSGDSGGPALMLVGGQEVQIGVTSFGDTDCLQMGVSTRVDAFADWISQATDGEVVPSATGDAGGGISEGCRSHDECPGGVCVSDGTQSLCTTTCTSRADCDAGMDCYDTGEDVGVCWPSDEPTTIDPGEGTEPPDRDRTPGGGGGGSDRSRDDGGSGCTVATPDGRGPLALLALLPCLWFARRRSRATA